MNSFFSTLGLVREEINHRLVDAQVVLVNPKFFSDAFDSFCSGVPYGETRTQSAEIETIKGKKTRKWAHASICRLESGNYELTFYIL